MSFRSRARRLLVTVAMLAVAAPSLADASQLIINGVPIGKVDLSVQGLEGVTFEKCTWVKVVAGGDVKIECPGYDLQSAAPPPVEPAKGLDVVAGRINKRYWLITEQVERGATQFDIDVYVNAKWIKRFKNDDEQIVMEITRHLLPGKNKVLFAATKNLADGRRAVSPNVFYRIVIGEGEEGGGNVMIDNPLIDIRRTAAETQNVTEEREILAR